MMHYQDNGYSDPNYDTSNREYEVSFSINNPIEREQINDTKTLPTGLFNDCENLRAISRNQDVHVSTDGNDIRDIMSKSSLDKDD